MTAVGLYNYWIVIFLMMAGFYIVIAHDNLVKKIVGLERLPSLCVSSLHHFRQSSMAARPPLSPKG